MANVLLGVTGSVAAVYTPELFAALTAAGHAVKVVTTASARYFFDPARIAPGVIVDEDEWPGEGYERGAPVLHIELRRWADLLLIAPLDANTLAKLAFGLCDNCLTCVWRAWERPRPVVLAPAMNTLMWEHPATARHLRQITEDLGLTPPRDALDEFIAWINAQPTPLRIVAPISKKLACDDVGIGALAERETLVQTVGSLLQPASGRRY